VEEKRGIEIAIAAAAAKPSFSSLPSYLDGILLILAAKDNL
jgi:hypothetical protein